VWTIEVAQETGQQVDLKRKVALRIISAYRTVSHEVATILAKQISLDILAEENARMFNTMCALREENVVLTSRMRAEIRNLER
jgi:hypothetical protein